MTARAAQLAFLAFFDTPRSSSSPCARFRSHFRTLNHYIPLSTGAVTEVGALLSALLAPHHECQPLIPQYAIYCDGDWELCCSCRLAKCHDLLEG